MLPEAIRRRVSFAVRVLDDVTGLPLDLATARIPAVKRDAIAKDGGFYVFADLDPGTHAVAVTASRHQPFAFSADTPVAAGTPSRLLRVHGENERILAIQSVLAPSSSVRVAATDVHPGVPAGATVIHQAGQTTLAAPFAGESVDEVELTSLAGLAANQFIRILAEPAIRLRPDPYYDLTSETPPSRRLVGTVRSAATGEPIAGARLEVRRVNGLALTARTLGATPPSSARFSSVGGGASRRVVGLQADIVSMTDERGRFALRFSPRRELQVDDVRLRVTAVGFVALDTPTIDLTLADETVQGPVLVPS